MPARTLTFFLLLKNAETAGFAFPVPAWWPVQSLTDEYASMRIALNDHDEALVLPPSAIRLAEWWQQAGTPLSREATDAHIQHALDQAEWVVLHDEWVWLATREPSPSTLIVQPYWWLAATGWGAPWVWQRFVEDPTNLLDLNYVGLLTPDEALALDRWHEQAFVGWKGGRLSAHDRQRIRHFRKALNHTRWVVMYWAEWESGL